MVTLGMVVLVGKMVLLGGLLLFATLLFLGGLLLFGQSGYFVCDCRQFMDGQSSEVIEGATE